MQKRTIAALGFCLVALFAVQAFFPTAQMGARSLHFWISNLEGKRFDSRKQKAPFVISFFFVDCVPCLIEVPQLYKMMSEEYPGAALLYVDPVGDDSVEYFQEFADRLRVPYAKFYLDPLSSMAKKFFKGRMVFPTIVGFNRGKEVYRVHDLSPASLQKIEQSLAKLKKG